MNPNNLQQISSFKKHHGKTRVKHLQIQTTVRRAQGWNSDISKTFQKPQQRFHRHRPFTCNLRSCKKNFHLSLRPESRQKFLGLRRLTEWRTVTTGVLLSDSPHGRIGQRELSMYLTKFSMTYYITCTFTCKITLGFPRNRKIENTSMSIVL